MSSASGLLDGNQAKRANFFKISSSGSHVDPQSAKPGSFSSVEPASFTGVVAGTKGCLTRRWNNGGGRVALPGDFLDYPGGHIFSGAGGGRSHEENALGEKLIEVRRRGRSVPCLGAAEPDQKSAVLECGVVGCAVRPVQVELNGAELVAASLRRADPARGSGRQQAGVCLRGRPTWAR